MTRLWLVLIAAVGGTGVLPAWVGLGASDQGQGGAAISSQSVGRDNQLLALRARARARIEEETERYSAADVANIEARYASAQVFSASVSGPERQQVLEDLIRRYPRSNRAGCARLQLAQLSKGPQREQYLRQAIAHDNDAWFENGVQVAALARALLAVHLAGLGQFDEAERLATELLMRFPGSVDQSGTTLDDTLAGIKLLRR
jgi:hypothetical protein